MSFSDYTMPPNIAQLFKELPKKLRQISVLSIYRLYEADIRYCLEVDVYFDELMGIFTKFYTQVISNHIWASAEYSKMMIMIHGSAVEKGNRVPDSVYFKTLREAYKVNALIGIVVWQRTTEDTDIYKSIWQEETQGNTTDDSKAVEDSLPNRYRWLMINLMQDKNPSALFGTHQSYVNTYNSIVKGYNQRQVLNT